MAVAGTEGLNDRCTTGIFSVTQNRENISHIIYVINLDTSTHAIVLIFLSKEEFISQFYFLGKDR